MVNANYFRSGEIIEITIKDSSGAKIEKHVCNANDKKRYASILRYLRDKYGFEPEIVTPPENPENLDWWG
jgi:RNA:NAD 2'-phosphotransferase (TPT1/KptA family)